MTQQINIDAAKHALRGEMQRRRGSLSAEQREAASKALGETDLEFAAPRPATVISGYAAIGEELDPLPLMTRLAARGHPLALPVVMARGKPLVFRRWQPGEALVRTGFGLSVPPDSAKELIPDILLVPLLAFDARGYRLGYGAGFYDRTLASLRSKKSIVAIGMAFDEQKVEKVPHDDYDETLDWVLTPSGVLKVERQ